VNTEVTSGACSRPQQIAALEAGESYAVARRLDINKATREMINAERLAMKRAIDPAVARAKLLTAAEYAVEVGDYRTRSGDLILVTTVTRAA
jgi:hypothetical protein